MIKFATLKFIFVIIILFSCQSRKPSQIDLVLENNDTALAKKLAQKELDSIRASITDSNFANSMDAGLLIQTLEFTLQKDSSRLSMDFSKNFILEHSDGQKLYNLMIKQYKRALKKTSTSSDITYFAKEISLSSSEWLAKWFSNKTTNEALISLLLLQKDVALISAIEINADTQTTRVILDRQYTSLINSMRKNY